MQLKNLTQQGQYLHIVLPLYLDGFFYFYFFFFTPSESVEETVSLFLSFSVSSKSEKEPSENDIHAEPVPLRVLRVLSDGFKVSFDLFVVTLDFDLRFDELLLF